MRSFGSSHYEQAGEFSNILTSASISRKRLLFLMRALPAHIKLNCIEINGYTISLASVLASKLASDEFLVLIGGGS